MHQTQTDVSDAETEQTTWGCVLCSSSEGTDRIRVSSTVEWSVDRPRCDRRHYDEWAKSVASTTPHCARQVSQNRTPERLTLREQCIGRLARPFGRWRLAGGAEKRVGKKSASWPRYALPENALSIPASSAIFIGIDPDVAGALGVLRVARNPHGIVLGDIKVVDMPSEIQIINRKKRRYVDG